MKQNFPRLYNQCLDKFVRVGEMGEWDEEVWEWKIVVGSWSNLQPPPKNTPIAVMEQRHRLFWPDLGRIYNLHPETPSSPSWSSDAAHCCHRVTTPPFMAGSWSDLQPPPKTSPSPCLSELVQIYNLHPKHPAQ